MATNVLSDFLEAANDAQHWLAAYSGDLTSRTVDLEQSRNELALARERLKAARGPAIRELTSGGHAEIARQVSRFVTFICAASADSSMTDAATARDSYRALDAELRFAIEAVEVKKPVKPVSDLPDDFVPAKSLTYGSGYELKRLLAAVDRPDSQVRSKRGAGQRRLVSASDWARYIQRQADTEIRAMAEGEEVRERRKSEIQKKPSRKLREL